MNQNEKKEKKGVRMKECKNERKNVKMKEKIKLSYLAMFPQGYIGKHLKESLESLSRMSMVLASVRTKGSDCVHYSVSYPSQNSSVRRERDCSALLYKWVTFDACNLQKSNFLSPNILSMLFFSSLFCSLNL